MSKWELPKDPQFYKWESPITEIFKQVEENYHKQLNDRLEEQLMCEINYQVGYSVDKNELIKALNYDREQYDKGYRDGVRETSIDELEKMREVFCDMRDGYPRIPDETLTVREVIEIIDSRIEEIKQWQTI